MRRTRVIGADMQLALYTEARRLNADRHGVGPARATEKIRTMRAVERVYARLQHTRRVG